MEFWGVEVKVGEPLKVTPEINKVIHLSQAVLGVTKKDKGEESIIIHVKVGNQKHVMGHLSLNDLKQLQFDLVFEKDFELSHNWKNGSVYFSGYQSIYGAEDDFDDSDLGDSSEEKEEDIPANALQNGKLPQNDEQAKPSISKGNAAKPALSEKPKVKVGGPSQDEDCEEDDSDDDDSDDDEEGSEDESDEDMLEADSDEDEDDDDEETPKKAQAQPGSKRPIESATKTPVSTKKAKTAAATPQKTGGKEEAHVATPRPAKNAAKTPAISDIFKAKTPKSGAQFSCKSCTKYNIYDTIDCWPNSLSFGSETALNAHSKAKHN